MSSTKRKKGNKPAANTKRRMASAKKSTKPTKRTTTRRTKPTVKAARRGTAASASQTRKTRQATRTEQPVTSAGGGLTLPEAEVEKIRASAERLGIELDEQEALQWLTQMAVQDKAEVTVDTKNFVYGAKVAILDFSAKDLEYYRRIGAIVALPDQPGVVETALALSGSAAQSKIQTNPGDADFFQRVNIKAPSREEAVRILAEAMRRKGLERRDGPDYHLLAVKFGTHAEPGTRGGKPINKGAPMTWSAHDLERGYFEMQLADGTPHIVRWEDGMIEPGWTKMDWVVADSLRGQLANASNLLDVTWEAPDGSLTPLDGVIDPYFQEVYLDAGSVPVFSKLVKHVEDNAMDKYVSDLEHEVWKYLVKNPNLGKVSKRAYNIFRLTGRYAEAAYIRELFDEPTTALYRVWSLFDTLSGAAAPESKLDRVALLKQYDSLIEQVIQSTEGESEARIVRALMRARDEALGIQQFEGGVDQHFVESRQNVIELLNTYFRERLYGFEPIARYLEEIRQRDYH